MLSVSYPSSSSWYRLRRRRTLANSRSLSSSLSLAYNRLGQEGFDSNGFETVNEGEEKPSTLFPRATTRIVGIKTKHGKACNREKETFCLDDDDGINLSIFAFFFDTVAVATVMNFVVVIRFVTWLSESLFGSSSLSGVAVSDWVWYCDVRCWWLIGVYSFFTFCYLFFCSIMLFLSTDDIGAMDAKYYTWKHFFVEWQTFSSQRYRTRSNKKSTRTY